jgi:hypothetical protein
MGSLKLCYEFLNKTLQNTIAKMYKIVRFNWIFSIINQLNKKTQNDRCVDLGKMLNNENLKISFGEGMWKIIMVKVGFFVIFGTH